MQTLAIPFNTGRVVILADMHLNTYLNWALNPIDVSSIEDKLFDVDALILAGDLINGPVANWATAFAFLARYVPPQKTYVFPGNHDYYGGCISDDPLLAQEAAKVGAHFVQKTALLHGDTRLLCCTLWTDFDLLSDQPVAMSVAQQVMRDYSRIARRPPDELPKDHSPAAWTPHPWIKPEDVLEVHHDHRNWLTAALAQPHPLGNAARTVVVTHHGPDPRVAGAPDALTPAFHSDLSDLIARHQPDAWFFGHSHRRLREGIGTTDVRNVSIGYPKEQPDVSAAYLRDACAWESRHGSE
ncbi:metallophosphoesterase [Gymnodinialimonas ulvae]|uniref:metallophosphoesterase n=1 Tax=Gymnodinialimonas ulvae TaxID=3126504 RepID=UPI00309E863A